MFITDIQHPLAITMWDFSWLERRWPGAGQEDWDSSLDALIARGYNAVRIDAYPHLVAIDPHREWELLPCWDQQDWGSPARTRVRIQPLLNEFIRKCAARGIKVALSTWFREDPEQWRKQIPSPARLAEIWNRTLQSIAAEGLLDAILFVDYCNEWPQECWAPFFRNDGSEGDWTSPRSMQWMREALDRGRQAFPDLSYCFSFSNYPPGWEDADLGFMDLLEPHVWMANSSDFYDRLGYTYQRFSSEGFDRIVRFAEPLYRADPEYWQGQLGARIEQVARWSAQQGKPLVTTECWGLVDYKDWPLLDWGYIKELCEIGTRRAVATGRWAAVGTSNFCAPQFHGMWRDVDWHRRLTAEIATGELPFAVH
ncbi:MAG: cellulase [Opitutales bacterium]|nr:cellulase [Opitutales bacterium]